MTDQRKFDVIVYGATGFTGKLVAEYLAKKSELPRERWAIAGRNHAKLAAVRADIGMSDLAIVEASADDPASLKAMAEQAKVVLTTVGPYIRYGEALVKACIEAETHYVDITGEPEFVDLLRERYDDEAKAKKLKIVSCCGFDSIPHDLGVLYTIRQIGKAENVKIEGFVRSNGSPSGGTWNSLVDAMERMRKQQKKAKPKPQDTGDRRIGPTKGGVRKEKKLGRWVVPMPTIDGSIVRRSARAIEDYGKSFRYTPYLSLGSLPKLVGLGAGMGGMFAVAQVKPGANWLRNLKPSGAGPSPEQRAKSKFEVLFIAEADGRELRTRVAGGDPGYTETSKMIAESALCLALDDGLPEGYGITTTAIAMGDRLIERLVEAGLVFETVA